VIDLDELQSTLKAEISVAQQRYQKSTDAWHFLTPDFKVGDKVFVKAKFFQTTWPSKKLSEKYLRPYKIIAQPSTLLLTLCLPESMHSVHPVFHVFMLKSVISNTFSKRIQLAPTLVIIDRKPEYEISQIVDSKIDHWWACKLLYKMIWLGYKNTGDKSKWIPTSELTHITNLVSDFHITYPTKPSPLPLSWSHYYICSLPLCIPNGNFLHLYFVCLSLLTLSFHILFRVSFQNFQTSFHFNSWFSYSHI